VEREAAPSVQIKHSVLVLSVRPGASEAKKKEVLERWYREQIKEIVPRLIAKWERIIGVKVQDFYVRRMKTKWGSCSASAGTIRFNSELAKKPRECLEYIVVHEMVHLLERTHKSAFRVSDGSVCAALAIPSRSPQSTPGASREVGLLTTTVPHVALFVSPLQLR
jgi:predicted metal-dependent hydrolase